jgi:hypothetical protein
MVLIPKKKLDNNLNKMVCRLLGDFVSILIQGLLGISALGSLAIKRILENPKREFRVFVYDVSKQAIGQLYAHGLNLLIAIHLTHPDGDQCVWYFVNFIVDVIGGLPLTYLLVLLTNHLAQRLNYTSLLSGEYIQDQWCINRSYLKQIGVWLTVVTTTKLLLYGAVLVPLQSKLVDMGETILLPVTRHHNETLELVVVMVLVPLSLNIIQYWIQDAFLKGKDEMVDNPIIDSKYVDLDDKSPDHNLSGSEPSHITHSTGTTYL